MNYRGYFSLDFTIFFSQVEGQTECPSQKWFSLACINGGIYSPKICLSSVQSELDLPVNGKPSLACVQNGTRYVGVENLFYNLFIFDSNLPFVDMRKSMVLYSSSL